MIQTTIKTPLADEVLFGKLKNGGAVQVVLLDEDGKQKLGFVFPEGPVLPKPERDIVEAGRKRPRGEPEVRRAKAKSDKAADKGAAKPAPEPPVRSVPGVPLKN